jgi:hypothetical protein
MIHLGIALDRIKRINSHLALVSPVLFVAAELL